MYPTYRQNVTVGVGRKSSPRTRDIAPAEPNHFPPINSLNPNTKAKNVATTKNLPMAITSVIPIMLYYLRIFTSSLS